MPSSKQPISRHPLFPATVALWFGALFGLGSMAIRPSLIEKAVLAIQLQAIIPAAEPPLGATARLLLALAMAGIGGVLGALLARRIGRPRPTRLARRRAAVAVADMGTPTAHDFGMRLSGEDHEDEAADNSTLRRRQLAVEEDNGPRDYQEHAPLPGGPPQILNVAEFDLEGFEAGERTEFQEFVAETNEAADAWDVGDTTENWFAEVPEAPEGVQVFGAPAAIDFEEDPNSGDSGDEFPSDGWSSGQLGSEFESNPRDFSDQTFEPQPADVPVRQQFIAQEDDPHHADADFWTPDYPEPDSSGDHPQPASPPFSKSGSPDREIGSDPGEDVSARTAASRIMSAKLSELSHVELLERLALTLEQSRSRQAETAVAPDFSAPSAANVSCQEADETIAASATKRQDEAEQAAANQGIALPPPATIPAALRPVDLDDDSDSDLLPGIVPPRRFSLTGEIGHPPHQAEMEQDKVVNPHFVEPGPCIETEPDGSKAAQADFAGEVDGLDSEERAALEEGYSSLLGLSRPDRQQFIRIEEPEADDREIAPFVVFPNEEPVGSGPFAKPLASRDSEPAWDAAEDGARPPASEDEERRFDQSGSGEPLAGDDPATSPRLDPRETERSLRAALATLQRMSGGA